MAGDWMLMSEEQGDGCMMHARSMAADQLSLSIHIIAYDVCWSMCVSALLLSRTWLHPFLHYK